MPTSLSGAIQPIIERIVMWKPHKILDVGIGWGKYGLLCREYLQPYKCLERLDGVEIFKPYVGPIQKAIYDHIYNEDITKHKFKTDYDLFLLIDVLEHLNKRDGEKLLDRMKGWVVVSTPMGFKEAEPDYNNEHERHISGWTQTDFMKYGIQVTDVLNNALHAIYFLDLRNK